MSLCFWQTARFRIDLSRPRVMGIVNVTPDSFSDGGQFFNAKDALAHAERLLSEGADLLDIGAESSRPGAVPLSLEEERKRLVPVLAEVSRWGVPVSVDTYKPEVMQLALDIGVDILNDIWGFRQLGSSASFSALEVAVRSTGCGLCVMHMHGDPQTMQINPMQGDAVPQVVEFLQGRLSVMSQSGVAPERVVLDPGIGFGKTVEQNFALLRRQHELLSPGRPLLVGWSRKSALAALTGLQSPSDRLVPSVAAAVLAVERGAKIVRVHDVAATVAGLKVGHQ